MRQSLVGRLRFWLFVEGEARCGAEDRIGGEEPGSYVDCRCCYPEVVGMGSVVERMFRHLSGVSQFGHGREKGISHRYDGRTPDRLFQAVTSGLGPAGDQCTVAKLADGHCGDEYLVPGHELDVWLQASAASFAERGAEDAGVYDDPHKPRAAANASSSSSSRSSMSRASMDVITGAA